MQNRITAIVVALVLAVLATMALVVYVRSADRRAISDQSPVRVFRAKETIPANTTAAQAQNRGLIEQAELPRKAVARDAIVSLEQIAGRVAAVTIVPGEQLIATRWVNPEAASGQNLLPIPANLQAVSISVDLTRQVSGFITPGDRVSVVASFDVLRAGKSVHFSRFLLQDVLVLAVGNQAVATPGQQARAGQNRNQNLVTVTLATEPTNVERVVFAAEYGSIYLSLLPPGQKPVETQGRTIDNEF